MKIDQRHCDNTFRDISLMMAARTLPDPPLLMWQDVIASPDHWLLKDVNRHADFYALYIVQRGRGTHVIEDIPYAISRGDVYVMGPGTTHSYRQCQDLAVQGFYYTPDLLDESTRRALAEVPGVTSLVPGLIGREEGANRAGRWLHLTPAAYEQVADEVSRLNIEWEGRRPGSGLVLRGLFTCLLIHLARFHAEAHPSVTAIRATAHEAAITVAIRIMEERYAESLRIEQIAAAVFLSYNRFTQVFSQAVGQTPRTYLGLIRMERAKALLASTQLSMTAIADQAGFGDPAYFARAFHAATGMAPSEYRRRT